MDAQIEIHVQSCMNCQRFRHSSPTAAVHPWIYPKRPWSRIHLDFAGPHRGVTYLVTVDAYSKWLEVEPVASSAAATTISALRRLFATHGIPDVIVTDNGSTFKSEEFQSFLRLN